MDDQEIQLSDPYGRYFAPGINSPTGFRSAKDKFKGKQVRIPKGTLIHSMHPSDPNEWFPIKKTCTITVFASAPGHVMDPYKWPDGRSYKDAVLTWPGSGGYWKDVRLRDVEILDDIEGIPLVTVEELLKFDESINAAFPPRVKPGTDIHAL